MSNVNFFNEETISQIIAAQNVAIQQLKAEKQAIWQEAGEMVKRAFGGYFANRDVCVSEVLAVVSFLVRDLEAKARSESPDKEV